MGWALLAILVLLWLMLPREPARTDVHFDPSQLDLGVGAYLARVEARVTDRRPGVEKRVLWHGAPEVRTPWAVVYIHGFSATSEELRPLPDKVAQGLGANIVFTRLRGHGRSGQAMAEASVEGWMEDVAEALAIGHRIGERVLVMGCSTGCTLITLALHEEMGRAIDGVVLLAPNFRVRDPKAMLTTWRGARYWLPLLAGRERGFTPSSEAHGQYWTARYPSVGLLPMGAAVRAVNRRAFSDLTTPVLFVFDDRDALVDHTRTREVAALWGGPSDIHAVQTGPGDDPGHHVIAGDILSPGMTDPIAQKVLDWARRLDVS